MIPNHYSLNVAYDGNHWARVKFELDDEPEARRKAMQIAEALRATYGVEKKWSFSLVHVECSSRAIA